MVLADFLKRLAVCLFSDQDMLDVALIVPHLYTFWPILDSFKTSLNRLSD